MNRYFRNITAMLLLVTMLDACGSRTQSASQSESKTVSSACIVPIFNADSAYNYVAEQCKFGPRVPGTQAHKSAAEWLELTLKRFGAEVIVQDAPVTTFDGTRINGKNIIAQYNTKATKRILLLAHWDSRPWADNDPDKNNWNKPVMGANDGASGVGVLLEIARQLGGTPPTVGVDILLVDVEDWGDSGSDNENSWALGTQYWAANMHKPEYKAEYGILLDMVGGHDAVFSKEIFSMRYAPNVVAKIWKYASDNGYEKYFNNAMGGAVTDDHIFINRAGIPCVDIIEMNNNSDTGFNPRWHTVSDNMEGISAATLRAVGQTVSAVIYGEK